MDFYLGRAFNTRTGCQIGHYGIGFQVFRTAVGISAVIHCIYPYKYIRRPQHFGPGERIRKEYGVPGGYVGDGNFLAAFIVPESMVGGSLSWESVFGDSDVICEGGAANAREVGPNYQMLLYTEFLGHAFCSGKFKDVPLAIVEAEGVKGVVPFSGDGHNRC